MLSLLLGKAARNLRSVQSPPSSGGVLSRALSVASASGVRIVGFVPLWLRLIAERLSTRSSV
jgi:hypothetical protein